MLGGAGRMLSRLQELRKEEETLLRVKAALHDQLTRLKVGGRRAARSEAERGGRNAALGGWVAAGPVLGPPPPPPRNERGLLVARGLPQGSSVPRAVRAEARLLGRGCCQCLRQTSFRCGRVAEIRVCLSPARRWRSWRCSP